MTLDEVKAAVSASTVIVICGCKTFELVQKIVADTSTQVKVGFGITYSGVGDPSDLEANDCMNAAQNIAAALMTGKSLDQAAVFARKVIGYSASHFGAGVSYDAPGLSGNLSLQGNGVL